MDKLKIIIIGFVLMLMGGCMNTPISVNEESDWLTQCSLNVFAESDCLALSSHNPDVDNTGSREDLWEAGGRMIYLDEAETLNITSTHANDTFGGSGLNVLFVSCINSSGHITTESINMSGTSIVQTSIQCFRPRFIAGVLGGASEENIGNIIATSSSSGHIQMVMDAMEGLSKNSQFTVPVGQTATIKQVIFGATKSGGNSPIVEVKGKARFLNTSIWIQTFDFKLDTTVSDVFYLNQPISNELTERTDYRLEVTSSIDNTDVLARSYVVFQDNE